MYKFSGYRAGRDNESLKELDRRLNLEYDDPSNINCIDIHAHCFDRKMVSQEIIWAFLKQRLSEKMHHDDEELVTDEDDFLDERIVQKIRETVFGKWPEYSRESFVGELSPGDCAERLSGLHDIPKEVIQNNKENGEWPEYSRESFVGELSPSDCEERLSGLHDMLEEVIQKKKKKKLDKEKKPNSPTRRSLRGIYGKIVRMKDFVNLGLKKDIFQIVDRYFESHPNTAAIFLPIAFTYRESHIPKIDYYINILVHLAMAGCVDVKNEQSKWLKCYRGQISSLRLHPDVSDSEDRKKRYEKYLRHIQNNAEKWKKWKGQFIPAVGIDPNNKDPEYIDFINKCINELGAACVKLYPAMGFHPTDRTTVKLLQELSDRSIPIISHASKGGVITDIPTHQETGKKIHILHRNDYYNDLEKLKELFDLYTSLENLKISFSHLGGAHVFRTVKLEEIIKRYCRHHHDGEESEGEEEVHFINNDSFRILDLVRQKKNVYTDLSYTAFDQGCNNLVAGIMEEDKKEKEELFKEGEKKRGYSLGNKIMFGTDYWISLMHIGEKDYYKVSVDSILKNYKQKIAIENCRRFLGLD